MSPAKEPKTYTFDEVWQKLTDDGVNDETDNQGQIIIYTGFYRWHDDTIRTTADPRYQYPIEDWKEEVHNDYTKLGYEEWLEHKMEIDQEEKNT